MKRWTRDFVRNKEQLIWQDDNKMTEEHWSFQSLQNKKPLNERKNNWESETNENRSKRGKQ